MFNGVGDVHLEAPSIVGYVYVVLRTCADLDGLHNSEHTRYMVDPLSPGELPPDSAS